MEKSRGILLASLLMLSLLTTGCGSSGATGGSPSNAKSATSKTVSTPAVSAVSDGAKRNNQVVTIACGTSAGVGYITTTTAGSIFTKLYPMYSIKPELTTGSQENVNLVVQGDAQIGVCMADSSLAAYNGNREFNEFTKGKIRFVTGGYQTVITQFVPKSSTAKSIADLKGKKIGVSKGVMSQYYFPLILKAYGLSKSDFRISELSISDMTDGIKNGTLVYGIHVSSVPNSAISDLAISSTGAKILSMSSDIQDKIIKENPYFTKYNIPKATYSTDQDATTLATRNVYICSAAADQQMVYDWVKTLVQYHNNLAQAHPQAGDFGGKDACNALAGQLIPIAPGAERYYKEIGVMK